jgi:hypothetical protein
MKRFFISDGWCSMEKSLNRDAMKILMWATTTMFTIDFKITCVERVSTCLRISPSILNSAYFGH